MKRFFAIIMIVSLALGGIEYSKVMGSKHAEPKAPLTIPEMVFQDVSQAKPLITSHFNETSPAPSRPMLTWTVVPGAVYYEVEFLSAPPENPNGTSSSVHRTHMSREVFTNGYNPDLASLPAGTLYWRVRALSYDAQPLGVFSDTARLTADLSSSVVAKPLLTADLSANGTPALLYPAYSWIPIFGAATYEVEVTDNLPENPNTVLPSLYRIWSKQLAGFACYDEEARLKPGTYYWRVRGIDAAGNPVGVWSDAGKFVVSLNPPVTAATFGDSITHGGGAVSYSPADGAYSYQTYLSFPTVNLGRSGDTSETMLERFDREVLPFNPKILIILGATNSVRGGIPATDIIRDLSAIRNKCLQQGIRPVFLTLPPVNPANIEKVFNEKTAPTWRTELDTVNRFIRQQRYVIDIEPYFTDTNGELPNRFAIDGLHPDITGKKLIAHIVNSHWQRVSR